MRVFVNIVVPAGIDFCSKQEARRQRFFSTTLMLRVSFSPTPECVDADCWNRCFRTPAAPGARKTRFLMNVQLLTNVDC